MAAWHVRGRAWSLATGRAFGRCAAAKHFPSEKTSLPVWLSTRVYLVYTYVYGLTMDSVGTSTRRWLRPEITAVAHHRRSLSATSWTTPGSLVASCLSHLATPYSPRPFAGRDARLLAASADSSTSSSPLTTVRACSETLPLPKSAPGVGGAVAKNGGVEKRQLHRFSDFRELEDRRTAPKRESL